ncbi:pilin [Acinetobacter junii]|uniref:pilin n=1 Tax=Acinetobacter junii TaxID=40215 RepID=UPI0012509054|nr:pilin [Acinetobacter junii]MDI6621000.1 pilin [Acinetobacter junii]
MKANGFTLIELMSVIAIVGVLSAIAFPVYNDYIVRSKVSEVVMATAVCRTAVTEASQSGFISPPLTGLEFSCGSASGASNKVAIISTNADGLIAVQAQNIPELGGKVNLELIPYSDGAMIHPSVANDFATATAKEVRAWKCQPKQDGTGIDVKYLPINCR